MQDDKSGKTLKSNEIAMLLLGTDSSGALPTTQQELQSNPLLMHQKSHKKASAASSVALGGVNKGGSLGTADMSQLNAAQASQLLKYEHGQGKLTSLKNVGVNRVVRHRRQVKRNYHALSEEMQERGEETVVKQTFVEDTNDKEYQGDAVIAQDNDDEDKDEFLVKRVKHKKVEEKRTDIKSSSAVNSRSRDLSSDSSCDESDTDDSVMRRRRNRRRRSMSDSSSSRASSDDDSSIRDRRRNRGRNKGRIRRNTSKSDSGSDSSSSSSSSSSSDENERMERNNAARARMRQRKNETRTSDYQDQHDTTSTQEAQSSDNTSIIDRDHDDNISHNRGSLPRHQPMGTENKTNVEKEATANSHQVVSSTSDNLLQRARSNSSSSSSSESSSSSSSESSSSASSSSSSDSFQSPIVMSKPLFVPKHKRQNQKQDLLLKQQNEEQLMLRKEQEEKRIRESRAMVAEIVTNEQSTKHALEGVLGDQNEFTETGGTTVPPPDDRDVTSETDQMKERENWEVRELLRVLRDFEEFLEEQREKRDLERRRNMTDEERLKEDIEAGRYKRPGEQRMNKQGQAGVHLQRYFHRGAFYMDEDTLKDKNDVRNRAAEYAKATTGDDKFDKKNMPKVMQVKKFGFAGYSTKYKGLAKEDTTDKKGMGYLPVHKKRGRDNKH
jgi:microfibrillar-associated protein 1